MKKRYTVIAGLLAIGSAGWFLTAPPSYHEPGRAQIIGDPPTEILQADIGDVIAGNIVTLATDVKGHDEILPIPGTNDVLVSARDEWIWRVNSETGTAEKLAYSPVSPTGARMMPGNKNLAFYCMARLDHNIYDKSPGLYLLDIEAGTFSPLVTRVPITGNLRNDGLEVPNFDDPDTGKVHVQPFLELAPSDLNDGNSRPMQFCNDLDVTTDGRYVYFTEPFSHPKASSGLGAVPEAITLARNGRVWRYDTETQKVGLVVENSIFADGILVEYSDSGTVESLLITETVNFAITRAYLTGPKAGEYKVLWKDLPSLPDGMDRDADGRIWVGLIKARSGLSAFIHARPALKNILLRLPAEWLIGIERETGFVVFSQDASEVLAYTVHSGEAVRDLSVVIPSKDKLWLSSFFKDNVGVHYVPINAIFKD